MFGLSEDKRTAGSKIATTQAFMYSPNQIGRSQRYPAQLARYLSSDSRQGRTKTF